MSALETLRKSKSNEYEYRWRDLQGALELLKKTCESELEAMERGRRPNSLGIVFGQGLIVDRLCAEIGSLYYFVKEIDEEIAKGLSPSAEC